MKEDKLSNYDRFAVYYGSSDIQMDIYRRSEQGQKWNNLNRKICHPNNILFALKRLQNNKGRNTPGPNGITFKEYTEQPLETIRKDVIRLLNTPEHRIRTVEIPKKNGKTRTLGIADIQVRVAQQCICNILECVLEAQFSPRSYGYRRNKSAQLCIGSISAAIKNMKDPIIYDCDLKSYFDTIPLDRVIHLLKKNHNIYDSTLLKWIKNIMHCSVAGEYKGIGLAQGSILGPILANVMLHDWEEHLAKLNEYPNARSIGKPNSFLKSASSALAGGRYFTSYRAKHPQSRIGSMFRFADDLIIISNNEQDLHDIIAQFKQWCKKNGLTINEEKTKILTRDHKGIIRIDFVGYMIKMNKDNKITLCIKNQNETIRKIIRSIRHELYNGRADLVLAKVNGFINFYDIATSLKSFIDKLTNMLYWRKRRKRGCKCIQTPGTTRYEILPFNPKFIDRKKPYILDAWEIRTRSSKSYKEYVIDKKKQWTPNIHEFNETQWTREVLKGRRDTHARLTGFIPGLIRRDKKEPILGIPYTELDPNQTFIIHHKVPLSGGGTHDFKNLVLLTALSHGAVHERLELTIHHDAGALKRYIKMARGEENGVGKTKKIKTR